MSQTVKAPRTYHSPKRAAQAAATRKDIIDAATQTFAASGYAGTSLADIATAAGVAPQTVKAVFGTKRNVLMAAWDHAVKGDIDEEPVADQPWFQELVTDPDPRKHIECQVRVGAGIKARISPLIEVIRGAAPTDPDIQALWDTMQREFFENQLSTIRALQRKTRLRDGISQREAAEILWTLNHPLLYQLLVGERGWTPAHYQRWLTATLTGQLVGDE